VSILDYHGSLRAGLVGGDSADETARCIANNSQEM
jgi:hypothetical protein